MYRRLYQITLVVLQVALFVQLAPPLAQALRHGVAFGAFPEGFLAVIQLASAVATVSAAPRASTVCLDGRWRSRSLADCSSSPARRSMASFRCCRRKIGCPLCCPRGPWSTRGSH